jgi:hypothetical protein
VYVAAGGEGCASAHSEEAARPTGITALSAPAGDELTAGAFNRPYSFTPPSENGYSVCAYLEELAEGSTVERAQAGFAAPGGPVQAPYLFNPRLQEEAKRLAVEHELQELQEQERLRTEKAALERIPASELVQPQSQPAPQTLRVPKPLPHCIVPSLKRRSLTAARIALRRAHCTLGKVARPRRAGGALVVKRQSAARGAKLRDEAAVAVVLGPSAR